MKSQREQLVQERIKELREDTNFISALFESLVGYAIIAADFDGNVLAFNEGARQIYGYAPEEIIGKQSIELFLPNDFIDGGGLQRIIDTLTREGRVSCEEERIRQDGERFPAQSLYTTTKDKFGRVVGFIEIVEDLTERKKAEQAEAEAKANAEKVEQLEKEIRFLEQFAGSSSTTVTAQAFGLAPLREGFPAAFDELVQRYGDLMDLSLEQTAYKVEHNIPEQLTAIAEELGAFRTGPRDVVEIHRAALDKKTKEIPVQKAQAYIEEGRLMVLELMGYLVSYYRRLSLGARRLSASEGGRKDEQ